MSQLIQQRRDTAANWTTINPVLAQAEIVVETDTGKIKVGNGTQAYTSLPYLQTSGATAFSSLTDAATVNLPTTNAPLATALSTLTSSVGAKADASATTTALAAKQASLVAGTNLKTINSVSLLSAGDLAVQAPLVSATNIKTINGASVLGSGDMSVSGATAFTALTDASTAALPTTNTPLATALAGKAAILTAVDLGTGATTLTSAANANRSNRWHGTSDTTLPVSTSGSVQGDIIEVINNGSGNLTFSGVTAGTGYTLTFGPNVVGAVEFNGTAWVSLTFAANNGASIVGTISPSTVTEGGTLTFTPAAGWAGTYQWTKDGTNITGATSSTYVTQTGDSTHTINCKFSPTTYIPTGIVPSAPVVLAPNAATGLTSSSITTTGFTLSWTASAVDGGHNAATSYTYEIRSPAGSGSYGSAVSATSPQVITGLTASTSYGVIITAHNTGGTTDSTELSVTTTASVTGSIVVSAVASPGAENLSTGYIDYYGLFPGGAPSGINQKHPPQIAITGPTFVNGLSWQSWNSAGGQTLHINAGDAGDGTHTALDLADHSGFDTGGATNGKMQFVVPAGVASHKVRCWFGEGCLLRATLSDGSAAEQTVVVGSGTKAVKDVTFNAGSAGQSLTLSFECNGASLFTFEAIAYV